MTNSKYRLGDFYFKLTEEPSRVDIKRIRRQLNWNPAEMMSPYTIMSDAGHRPSSIVMQGYLTDFTEGSTGDFGFEKLTGEMSEIAEKIIEVENFDSTNNVRRYYGFPLDFKYTTVGTRPLIFDYLISFICPNPYAYDDVLQYTPSAASVQTTDTTLTCTGLTDGSAPTHPVFIYYNDTGSTVTSLTISDGATTTTGNILTVTGSLLNGDSWVTYPIKYNDVIRTYELNAVWTYDGDLSSAQATDQYTGLNASDSTVTVGQTAAITNDYPQITANAEVFKAKASHNNGDLHAQYRPNWG